MIFTELLSAYHDKKPCVAFRNVYLVSNFSRTSLSLQEYIDSLMYRLQALPQQPAQPSPQDAASITPEDTYGSSNRAQAVEAPPQGALEPPPPSLLVRSLLCYTLLGHRCDLLTITDFSSPLELVRPVLERGGGICQSQCQCTLHQFNDEYWQAAICMTVSL